MQLVQKSLPVNNSFILFYFFLNFHCYDVIYYNSKGYYLIPKCLKWLDLLPEFRSIPTTCRYPRKKIFVRFDSSIDKFKKTARKFKIFLIQIKISSSRIVGTLVNEAQWQETSSTNRVQLLSNPKSVGQITACCYKKKKNNFTF